MTPSNIRSGGSSNWPFEMYSETVVLDPQEHDRKKHRVHLTHEPLFHARLDSLLEDFDLQFKGLFEGFLELGRVVDCGRPKHLYHVPPNGAFPEVGFSAPVEQCEPVCLGSIQCVFRDPFSVYDLSNALDEQILLVPEILVERTPPDPGRIDYVRDRYCLVSFFSKESRGRLDDLGPLVVFSLFSFSRCSLFSLSSEASIIPVISRIFWRDTFPSFWIF